MVGLRFENICLQADVEVLLEGGVFPGKVKWKGKIPGKHGDWVGLELSKRIGTSNGCYKGMQYFSCTHGYGLFVRPSQLRFPPSKGRSYSSYHRISKESPVDEELFGYNRKEINSTEFPKSCFISSLYATNARDQFPEGQSISERRNYHLGHPISSRFALNDRNRSGPISEPKAIQKQNLFATKAQEKPTRKLSTGLNVHRYTNGSCYVFSKPFISSPSIPLTHKLPSNAWI